MIKFICGLYAAVLPVMWQDQIESKQKKTKNPEVLTGTLYWTSRICQVKSVRKVPVKSAPGFLFAPDLISVSFYFSPRAVSLAFLRMRQTRSALSLYTDRFMDLLQGFHFPVAMQLHVVDALGGCPGGSHGGHIRNLGLDGGFPQVAVVIHAVLSGR